MAKLKGYEIASFLNQDSQPEQEGGSDAINIKMISVYDLVPNPNNFYKTDTEIEKLADEIEAQGNITPLDVKKIENNKYMIISGHRRRKAILHLLSNSDWKNEKVPCVIREYVDETEEQAAIVFANSQRIKTDEELSEEIERAKPYIERRFKAEREKAKAEGLEFPKFRKYLAEKLGVSETTIHREESYKKIAEEIKDEVKAGNTTKTAIAEIASMSHEEQKNIYEAAKDESGRVSVKAIQEQKENFKKDVFYDEAKSSDDSMTPCEQCRASNPQCADNHCCKTCKDTCNTRQICRIDESPEKRQAGIDEWNKQAQEWRESKQQPTDQQDLTTETVIEHNLLKIEAAKFAMNLLIKNIERCNKVKEIEENEGNKESAQLENMKAEYLSKVLERVKKDLFDMTGSDMFKE